MRTKINSQSTAAVNSAYVIFTSNCSKSGFLQMSISNVNDVDVITFVGRTIDEQKKDAYFEVRISNGISIQISFTKNYFSKKYEISYRVFVNGEIDYDACSNIELDFKVMSGVNVNKAVGAVARLIMEFIEDNKENNYTEISEAPVLDEAPSLDETPMLEDDDDVMFGYSVEGLAYVKENLEDVDIVSMVKESMGDLFNDPYTMENIMRGGVLDQEKFADALWDIVWEEYLCGLTDEALESETRYYTDFDALCLQMCGAVAAYNEVMRVVKNNADSVTYGAQGFSWDLFTERVMSELEGGDIVDILPYDDGPYLSFVGDEAEIAA